MSKPSTSGKGADKAFTLTWKEDMQEYDPKSTCTMQVYQAVIQAFARAQCNIAMKANVSNKLIQGYEDKPMEYNRAQLLINTKAVTIKFDND
jgi:hypothetical protein